MKFSRRALDRNLTIPKSHQRSSFLLKTFFSTIPREWSLAILVRHYARNLNGLFDSESRSRYQMIFRAYGASIAPITFDRIRDPEK